MSPSRSNQRAGSRSRSDDSDGDDEMDYTYEPGSANESEALPEERSIILEFEHNFHEDQENEDYEDGILGPGTHGINIAQLMPFQQLLLSRLIDYAIPPRRRREELPEYEAPIPSPKGRELMQSGDFGASGPGSGLERDSEARASQSTISQQLLKRELGTYPLGARSRVHNQKIAQSLVPSTKADFLISSDDRCYSGQFSEDGNFFYSCSQDFQVRMFDTSNPYDWEYYKTVDYYGGRWTITDASLSPDTRFLAYSSITSVVYLANTAPGADEVTTLDFSSGQRRNRNTMSYGRGIWSVRFSGDGRELVVGANDHCLYVYDIERGEPVLRLEGHQDDVNAVCYGDSTSPHILYSGSDDSTVKVWDRRSMEHGREVGVFPGHLEGVTYVDSKGDGRYVLSNGKDQTMKLWDIRKMMDPGKFQTTDYSSGFDYRSMRYPRRLSRHPQDQSLVTYVGHSVLQTLIRCHFSPETSTGARYVYTGSADGKVAIYNLDATRAGTIDVGQAIKCTNLPSSRVRHLGTRPCVRDVSWHPNSPVIAATSWSPNGGGSISLHSWQPKARKGVTDDEANDVTRVFNWEMEDIPGAKRRVRRRAREDGD